MRISMYLRIFVEKIFLLKTFSHFIVSITAVKWDTPSYTNKQHSNKQFLNKQYSKLQQKLPIVSTCKLPNLEFGL